MLNTYYVGACYAKVISQKSIRHRANALHVASFFLKKEIQLKSPICHSTEFSRKKKEQGCTEI